MLTVTVGLVASGNSSTDRPLSSRYSVMPSTERTSVAPLGGARAAAAPANSSNASVKAPRSFEAERNGVMWYSGTSEARRMVDPASLAKHGRS